MGAEIPDGAFVVARALFNSSLWTMRPQDCKVAVTLIGLANWRDKKWFDGEKSTLIKRGQLVRSLTDMAEACHVSLQTLRTSLKNLEKAEFLTRKSTQRYTIITLPKYDKYQDLTKYSDREWSRDLTRHPTNDQQTANKHLTNTQPTPNNKQEGLRRENNGKKADELEEEKGGAHASHAAPPDFKNDATASSEDVLAVLKYAQESGIYAASKKQLRSVASALLMRGYTIGDIGSVFASNKGADILKIDFGAGPPRATYYQINRESDVLKVEQWLEGWMGDGPKPEETRIGDRWYVKTPDGKYKYSQERTDFWIAEYRKGKENGQAEKTG